MLNDWTLVPHFAIAVADEVRPIATEVKRAAVLEGVPKGIGCYWHRSDSKLHFQADDLGLPFEKLACGHPFEVSQESPEGESWVKFAAPGDEMFGGDFGRLSGLGPHQPFMGRVARMTGFRPNLLFEHPTPLSAGLTSGILGAGLGYLGGWAGEQLFPEYKRGRLRRLGAILGALPGPILAATLAGSNLGAGKSWNDSGALSGEIKPGETFPKVEWSRSPHSLPAGEPLLAPPITGPTVGAIPSPLSNIKAAWDDDSGFYSSPPINVDQFNRVIWGDPRVAPLLPTPVQAAASGAVVASSRLGPNPGYTTAEQLGQLAVGMGGGYLGGYLAGKVLGTLVGLPQKDQDLLKSVGTYAGMIRSVVPGIYGR